MYLWSLNAEESEDKTDRYSDGRKECGDKRPRAAPVIIHCSIKCVERLGFRRRDSGQTRNTLANDVRALNKTDRIYEAPVIVLDAQRRYPQADICHRFDVLAQVHLQHGEPFAEITEHDTPPLTILAIGILPNEPHAFQHGILCLSQVAQRGYGQGSAEDGGIFNVILMSAEHAYKASDSADRIPATIQLAGKTNRRKPGSHRIIYPVHQR